MAELKKNVLYCVLLLDQCTKTNPQKQNLLSHLLFTISILEIYVSFTLNALCLFYGLRFDGISIVAESVPIFYQMRSKLIRMKLQSRQMKNMLEENWKPFDHRKNYQKPKRK